MFFFLYAYFKPYFIKEVSDENAEDVIVAVMVTSVAHQQTDSDIYRR